METTRQLLARVKLATGARSDYRLAKVLGVGPSSVRHWNRGTTLSDDMAIKVARLIHEPEGYVLACMAAERSEREEQRAIWRTVAERMRSTAAVLFVACLVGLLWEVGAPPELGGMRLASARADFTSYTLCIVLIVLAAAAAALFTLCHLALRARSSRAREKRPGNACTAPGYKLRTR